VDYVFLKVPSTASYNFNSGTAFYNLTVSTNAGERGNLWSVHTIYFLGFLPPLYYDLFKYLKYGLKVEQVS
jgi:hypothetical protein